MTDAETMPSIADQAREMTLTVVGRYFPEAKLTPEATFDSIGADSMEMCQLELDLETALGLPDYWVDLTHVKTIGQMMAYIEAKLQERARG